MTDQRKRPPAESLQSFDLLRKHHRFLRDSSSSEEDDGQGVEEKEEKRDRGEQPPPKYRTRGQQLAKKYYEQLYKEYALVDLRGFERGQVGCRWRTEGEVLRGKGEKECGEVRCGAGVGRVYELNFGYLEEGRKKNALVKVGVCAECAFRLNYKKALRRVQ